MAFGLEEPSALLSRGVFRPARSFASIAFGYAHLEQLSLTSSMLIHVRCAQ